ncbi:hypothetical protein HUT06_27285 [Actinomadura sp. NAK00032]|uniref:hypothetical protein n=1 Tax=Actinomadura sp. NAK00032 TaxID=2742128 RepID=UPI00159276ED|nr:hypothetical protein [Actinomadura sp. NAK00032]QKW37258.1 hypothetical protein HUT06_27285 [Actinomadura sp. NAK00032]
MEGNGDAQLSYRLLVAVDIQGYSRRDAREQLRAQRQLTGALDRAARGVGLDRARWDKQVGGDGELATLPEGTDPAPVAGDFVILLDEALREINEGIGGAGEGGGFPLRVRLALHHGTLTAGPFGPAGDAPITVQRLLDATPLRRLLSGDTGRDLAYVVSDSLFDDVVRTGFCALPPREFQAVKVAAKGAVFRGHIHTGRAAGRAAGARGGPVSRPAPEAPEARVLTLPRLAAR